LKAIAVDDGSDEAIAPAGAPRQQPKRDANKASGRGVVVDEHAQSLTPRAGSKLALIVDLLERSEGATDAKLIEVTGWLPHTTRAALTGLRKRGYAVARERVGRGESIYRIAADAGQGRSEVEPGASDGGAETTPEASQAA
jgi:Protein of unknown function (DUF3489)